MATTGFYIIFGLLTVLSYFISNNLEKKIKKYSAEPLPMSGSDVAKKMLSDNGINDVTVTSVNGSLTDHYNPANHTVNLSETVFDQKNVAAVAVAAHECGHALQHAKGYAPLKLRSMLVPAVNISNKVTPWILTAGVVAIEVFPALLGIGVLLFAVTALFSLVTLPVEINASKRAIQWLDNAGIVDTRTKPMAVDALKSAAYTYVIAAVSSLATLVQYLLIFLRARR